MRIQIINIIVVKEGVVDENIAVVGPDATVVSQRADALFLKKCRERIRQDYSVDDLQTILDNGYDQTPDGSVSVCLSHADNPESESALFDVPDSSVVDFQRQLAHKAGTFESTGEAWQSMYDHHVGTVENPLRFEAFKRKMTLLDRLLKRDPEGKDRSLDRNILRLSNELGV